MPKVRFWITQDPEGIEYGILESVEGNEEDDEIVETFNTRAEAEAWIAEHTPVTEEYMRSRGIIK